MKTKGFNTFGKLIGKCGVTIPAGFVPFTIDGVITDYTPATSLSNLYIHAIFEGVNSNGFAVGTGGTFSGSTPGVLATDTASIQIALNSALVSAGFTAGQAVYTYDSNTNEIIIYQDPAILPGTFIIRGGGTASNGSYTNKINVGTTPIGAGTGDDVVKVKMLCDPSNKTANLGFVTTTVAIGTTPFLKDYINTSKVKSVTIVALSNNMKFKTGILDASSNPYVGILRQGVPYTWNQGVHFNGNIGSMEFLDDGDIEVVRELI